MNLNEMNLTEHQTKSIDISSDAVVLNIFNGVLYKDSTANAIRMALTSIASGFLKYAVTSIHYSEESGNFTLVFGHTENIDKYVAQLLVQDIEEGIKAPILLSSFLGTEGTQIIIDELDAESGKVYSTIISDFEVEPDSTTVFALQDTKYSFDCVGTITKRVTSLFDYKQESTIALQIEEAINNGDYETLNTITSQVREVIEHSKNRLHKRKPVIQKQSSSKSGQNKIVRASKKNRTIMAKTSKRRNRK